MHGAGFGDHADPGARRRGNDRGDHPAWAGAGDRRAERKLLAAHRGGIKTVIIPEENVRDLKEIPDNIKSDLVIKPVKWIDEVLQIAL